MKSGRSLSRPPLLLSAAFCLAWLVGSGSAALAADRADRREGPAPASAAVASDVRLGGDGSRTRFILDLSRSVPIAPFTLADPYRVVVDLPQVEFRLPPKAGESGRGLVKAFRFGTVMPGASRIVLDAAAPVRIDKSFMLEPMDGQPGRLVLDLVAVDRETFLRNLVAERKSRQGEGRAPPERQAAATAADPRPVVVIDPGHGGLDSGTAGANGQTEKGLVLEFAHELRAKLEKSGKYRVVMTRTDDSFISLSERVHIARASKAALFISIHADAIPRRDSETRGATVYTVSERASGKEAGRLAEAENRADAIAGVDLSSEPGEVADILIDLAQRETKSFSTRFAHLLVGELKSAVRLHKHPLQSAGFKVLKAPDVPSVLVELGYVSSQADLKLMSSDLWRRRAADSIAQAVSGFFSPRLAGNAEEKPSP